MKNKIFIQVGKFQTPNTAFHKGHLAVTKAILDKMNSGDLLYVSVASRGKAILFDKDTTIAIIREILRPLKNDNILVGSLDNNWLFGMYNVTKALSKLSEEEFKSAYIKRVHEFINELNDTSLVDLNKYEIVLVTGKEDDRGLVYTNQDELFKMNRNFEEKSDYPIQYYNIDLVMDDSGKVSSSTLRKEGKVLTCKDVWDNIDNSLCLDIDNNINKIVQNAPKIEERRFSIFEGLFNKFKKKDTEYKLSYDKLNLDGKRVRFDGDSYIVKFDEDSGDYIFKNERNRIVKFFSYNDLQKMFKLNNIGEGLFSMFKKKPLDKSMYDGHDIEANTTPRIIRYGYVAHYDKDKDLYSLVRVDGKETLTFTFDELNSKITTQQYPRETDNGTFIDMGKPEINYTVNSKVIKQPSDYIRVRNGIEFGTNRIRR